MSPLHKKIFELLVGHCCGDSDVILWVKDNRKKGQYQEIADEFSAWLASKSEPMYKGWEREEHGGMVLFGCGQDAIYICGEGERPIPDNWATELEITIIGE